MLPYRTEYSSPSKVFKFVKFQGAVSLVQNGTLKFAHPQDFNDPNDCDVTLWDFDFTGKLNWSVVAELNALHDKFKYHPFFAHRQNHPKFWNEVYKSTQLQKTAKSGICCFSLINTEMLMWSYYAEEHKGVCFEFEYDSSEMFPNLKKSDISEGYVFYEPYARINFVAVERIVANAKLYFTKEEKWDHEREFRLIILNEKPEYQPFKKKYLKAIYFGLKVTPDQRRTVIGLVKKNGYPDVKYFLTKKIDTLLTFERTI